MYVCVFKHWLEVINSTSSSFPISRGSVWDWKFQHLDHGFGSPGNQPPSRDFAKVTSLTNSGVWKELVLNNNRCSWFLLLVGNFKSSRSFVVIMFSCAVHLNLFCCKMYITKSIILQSTNQNQKESSRLEHMLYMQDTQVWSPTLYDFLRPVVTPKHKTRHWPLGMA